MESYGSDETLGEDRKPPGAIAANECGAEARAKVEADDETRKREDPDDEAASEAGESGQGNERESDEINGRHASRFAEVVSTPARTSGTSGSSPDRIRTAPLQSLGPRGRSSVG